MKKKRKNPKMKKNDKIPKMKKKRKNLKMKKIHSSSMFFLMKKMTEATTKVSFLKTTIR